MNVAAGAMGGEPIDVTDAETGADSTSAAARDFEAEARQHGWTPKEDFRGDPNRWVDAETYVKRADEVMPLLKKQNEGLKRELAELKRSVKQASDYFTKAEERAYTRALAEIEAKMDAAVEVGDVNAAKAARKELLALEKPGAPDAADDGEDVTAQRKAELDAWVAENDWYVVDDAKRRFADHQANQMGPAENWPGGQKAWLAEIAKRVDKRFAEQRPSPTNSGGNRPGASGQTGRTFNDLPPEAQRMCDKFVKQGIIKDRAAYLKSYQW